MIYYYKTYFDSKRPLGDFSTVLSHLTNMNAVRDFIFQISQFPKLEITGIGYFFAIKDNFETVYFSVNTK